MHEQPSIPNYEDRFARCANRGIGHCRRADAQRLPSRAVEAEDGWTIRTRSGCLAVHEEHTIVARDGLPLIIVTAVG